jgi:prepilin-type N-terminal cleavage/methylation domain-containing protein
MKSSQYPKSLSQNEAYRKCQGFTLIELLVTAVAAGAVLGASLGLINEQRRSFLNDRDRININDNLRVALSLVGDDIKQAGERLEQQTTFPVISVIDGTTGAPDRIILQRRKLAEVLTLCKNLSAGDTTIEVADAKDSPNCTSGTSPNVSKWQEERWRQDNDPANNSSTNEKLWAYIFDPTKAVGTQRGEFIRVNNETKGSCSSPNNVNTECWKLTLDSAPTLSYAKSNDSATQPKLYVLEQREYRLSDDTMTSRTDDKVLELIVNNQTPQRITNLLSNIQIRVRTVSDSGTETWNTSFNPNLNAAVATDWQTVGGIEVTLNGLNPSTSSSTGALSSDKLTLKSQFLPRNVASQTR